MSADAMSDHPGKPEIRFMQVSPEQAREWLGYNNNNRRLRGRHVAFLRGCIKRGEWALSNDAICFGPDGTLYNGQHRLTAIAESGVTVPLLVMFNADRATQLAMDTGAKRAPHDQMQIMGVKSSSTTKAALARAVLNYDNERGPITRVESVSTAEIIGLAENDEMLDAAMYYTGSLASKGLPNGRTTMMSLGYYLILNAWPEKVDAFHTRLAEGTELKSNDPILRFRNLLISGGVRQSGAIERKKLLAMFLKTFNTWVDGKEIQSLRWREDEGWPVPYTEASYARAIRNRDRGLKGVKTRRRQQ